VKIGTERSTNRPFDTKRENLCASHDGLQVATVPIERLFCNVSIASFEVAIEHRKQVAA
jgi:hypothetical protein